MTSDGKVIISTELDNNGVAKGVKQVSGQLGGLKSTVKSLGAAIASVFALRQIISFAKESSQAAMDLSNALTGLQSILEGQGRSFSAAKKFIEEYTQDGLIPATNAITAYKNLASRGYDDTQIRQVMVALKDASAYGRQASYTMGEAVESATEGLRNENSILVDNAGVTKNVAKMWEEYAVSIGTTTNNLTQQQKIQAEVNGILAESKYQAGDAATVAGTLSGQLQQLSFNFNNLKVAVGNAINPIVQTFLPIINTAIAAVTRFANAVAAVVGALFGRASVQTSALVDSNNAVASSASAGAAAEEELADATKAAGKAAQKTLAGFDELNKLQSNAGVGADSSGGASGGGGASSNITADTVVEDTISPKLQAIVNKIKELIEPLKQIDFTPAVEAFGRFREAIAPLTTKLFAGLEWAWYNILVPLAEWTIENVLPVFLDLVSEALGLLNVVIDGLQPLAIWLWDEFLQPLAEWTGGVIVDVITGLADALNDISDWIAEHKESINHFVILLGSIAGAFGAVVVISAIARAVSDLTLLMSGAQIVMSPLLGTIMAWISQIGIAFSKVGAWISGIATTIGTVLSSIAAALGVSVGAVVAIVAAVAAAVAAIIIYGDEIKAALNKFTEWLKEIFLRDWTEVFGKNLGGVLNTFFGILSNYFAAGKQILFGFIDFIQGVFTGSWAQAWDGLAGIAKGAVNSIISVVNGMISVVVSGINALFRLLSINIPFPNGGSIGWALPQFSAPQIPYLAQGAVIPPNREFMAVLGDQKHGTNIEAPEDLIRKIVREEAGNDDAVVELLELLIQTVQGIKVGDEVIGRAAARYQRKSSRAMGV